MDESQNMMLSEKLPDKEECMQPNPVYKKF